MVQLNLNKGNQLHVKQRTPISLRAAVGRGPTGPTGPTGPPGPAGGAWTAAEVVGVGTVRQAPDGTWIKSTAARTTRSSFDATEATFWTAVAVSTGTIEQVALTAQISGAVGTEATTRAAADTTLTNNLATETSARTSADAAEAAARAAADTTLTTNLATEVTNRTNADTAEANSRAAADALRMLFPSGGGSDGLAVVKDSTTTEGVKFGTPIGVLSRSDTGTLLATIPGGTAEATGERNLVSGGGFMNGVVGADPSIPAQAALAGVRIGLVDVGGTYISFDYGKSWQAANQGKSATKHMKSATVAFDPVVTNRVVLVTCNADAITGGTIETVVWLGTIDTASQSLTWVQMWNSTAATTFGAAKPILGRLVADGANHPRQTQNMLVIDPVTPNRFWLGTIDGVVYITNTNVTAYALTGAATPNYITGLAVDAAFDRSVSIIAYVTVVSGTDAGVWKMVCPTTGSGAPFMTKLTGGNAPTGPLGIVCVKESTNNVLYVADAGQVGTAGGARRYNRAGSGAWDNITSGAPAPSSGQSPANNTSVMIYKAIDAVRVGSQTRVLIAHDGSDMNNTPKMTWTNDGSAATPSWTNLADSDIDTTYTIAGSNPPRTSWLFGAPNGSSPNSYAYYALSYSTSGWDGSGVHIGRDDPTKWIVSGRSGMWLRDSSAATPKWQVATNGVGAVISLGIACHPFNPGMLLETDSDWTAMSWGDTTTEPRMCQHITGSVNLPTAIDGRGAAFDNLGYGYITQANQGSYDVGKIWVTTAPFNGVSDSWVELLDSGGQTISARAMGGATDFGIRGIIVTRHSDGDLIVVALCGRQVTSGAVSGVASHSGIFRAKIGSAAPENWTRKDGTINAYQLQSNQHNRFHGDHGKAGTDAGCMYAYGKDVGLMRSTDYGNTWAVIFPRLPSLVNRYTLGVACDPANANVVYLTLPGEVWRIDNANNGTLSSAGATLTGTITAVNRTGICDFPLQPAVASDGTVYIAQGVGGVNKRAGLMKSTDGGVTWLDISDVRWKNQALLVHDMAISADDQTLYVATDGHSVVSHSTTPGTQTEEVYTKSQVDDGFVSSVGTTAYGRALLALANQAALQAAVGVAADPILGPLAADFSQTNQASVQDTGLTCTLEVGTYEVIGYLPYEGSITGDGKFNVEATAAGGATFSGFITWDTIAVSQASATQSINKTAVAAGTAASGAGIGAGSPLAMTPRGSINVTAAGGMRLRFAQNSVDAAVPSIAKAGGFVRFKKIA